MISVLWLSELDDSFKDREKQGQEERYESGNAKAENRMWVHSTNITVHHPPCLDPDLLHRQSPALDIIPPLKQPRQCRRKGGESCESEKV